MDGADDGFIQVLTVTMELRPGEDLLPDSLPHLGGRRVCKGDRSQLGDAMLPEKGDVALHEDTGLAAPGTRRDEHVDVRVRPRWQPALGVSPSSSIY